MDYDEAVEMTDPGVEIKEKFFQDYITPLLKDAKKTTNLPYFFHQGYLAWRLSVKKEDLERVKFVEWLCEELRKINEVELIGVLSSVLAQLYDVGVRTEQGERNLYNSQIKKDKEMAFSDLIRLYKIFFENEFRIHSTIPYLYACRAYKVKHKVSDPDAFVNVGASTKFHTLNAIKVSLPGGDISKLTLGFDNQIRNAGEGHDRWDITDKDTLVLLVVEPTTGEERARLELSEKDLEDLLKQCRKSVWILKMGYMIFLENNKDFEDKLKIKPAIKLRELVEQVELFAENRWFDIKKLEVNEDRMQVFMAVRYRPRVVGTKTQLFFGGGKAYDLIEDESFAEYEYHMLDIVKCTLGLLGGAKLPRVAIEMFGEEDETFGTVEYEPEELSKLFKESGALEIPVPSKGNVPDIKCRLVVFIKVPYGTRAVMEPLLRKMKKEKESEG